MTTTTPTRNQLHDLVDALPEEEIPAAVRALRQLTDPVLRALARAALREPEELTPEEEADVDEALADIAAGRVISHEEARWRLLGR